MNKYKFIVTLAIFISLLSQSCKDNPVIQGNDKKGHVQTDIDQSNIDKIDVDDIINKYAKQLSNSNIRIVDSDTCAQVEINRDMMTDQGINTYEYYSIKTNSSHGKIAGDLNGDNKTDYIANYSCNNCYDGIGTDNYLSNCFFLTSQDGRIIVDEEMTSDFKQKLIDGIKKDFGDSYFSKAEKEIMVNGIEFIEIKNQIAYGTFNINTDACGGSPFPCVKGTFEYDANNKTLKMSGKITVEEVEE